jgi:hypothetical protein
VGVPVAAFFHSFLQFAFDPPVNARGVWLFPLHFFLGVLVGSIVLVPAFSLQAAVFHALRSKGFPVGAVIVTCGACQAGIVALWAVFVGIQPSLSGRFHLTFPMIVAGFIAGVVTSISAIPEQKEGRGPFVN